MEGPPNAIRFAQTHATRFFMCRHCRNHVLSLKDCLYYNARLKATICQNPVNVRVDDILLRLFNNLSPVVNVCCNECNMNLGLKYVMITEPNHLVQEGRFIFYGNRLLFWNGTQLLYPDTNEQVFDN